MYFAGEPSKSSRLELNYLRDIRYWHRPGGGMQEVLVYAKENNVTSLHKAKNSYIELWVGSIVALALQQIESKDFWIGKPSSDPPDMAIMTISERGVFEAREIEITRAMSADRTLMESILHKDKPYPDKYILACFIEHPGEKDLFEVFLELPKKLKHLKNVVMVFHGIGLPYKGYVPTHDEIQNTVSVVQVSPVFSAIKIHLLDSLKEWQGNPNKLVHVRNGTEIHWGLRPSEGFPKIIA